jgi:hypothetical protein
MYTSQSNNIEKEVASQMEAPEYVTRAGIFGDYVRNIVFPEHKYTILHSKTAKPEIDPQYKMVCHEMDREFYLETRFRHKSSIDTYKIQWCFQEELNRYKELENEAKVFLALGFGEDPAKPTQVYIIPISSIHFTSFYETFLDKYAFYPGKPVFNGALWRIN